MSAFRSFDWAEIISNPLFTRLVHEMGLSRHSTNSLLGGDVTYVCDAIQCAEVTNNPVPGTHLKSIRNNGMYEYVPRLGDKGRNEIKSRLAELGLTFDTKIENLPAYSETRIKLAQARKIHLDKLDPLEKLTVAESGIFGLDWAKAAMQLCREDSQYEAILRKALPEGVMSEIFWGRQKEKPTRYTDFATKYGVTHERPRQIEKEAIMAIRQKIGFDRTLVYALGGGH